jgi:NADH-ubiquinone oxidoreductase chain 6
MKTFFINLLAFGTLISSITAITSKNPVISVIHLIATFVQAAGFLILIGINFVGISYIVVYVGAIAVLFLFVIMMINIKLTDILETGVDYSKNLPLAIAIVFLSLLIFYTILQYNLNNIPAFSIILNKITNLNTLFYDLNYNNIMENTFQLAIQTVDFFLNDLNYNNIMENSLQLSIQTVDFFFILLNVAEESLSSAFNADVLITTFEQIEILGHSLYTYGAILLIILSVILLLAMFAIIIISKSNNKLI